MTATSDRWEFFIFVTQNHRYFRMKKNEKYTYRSEKRLEKHCRAKSLARRKVCFMHTSFYQFGRHERFTAVFFLVETFRSFLLRHFGHLSHSCVKTHHNSVFSLYFQSFWPKWLNFSRSFKKRFGLDRKKTGLQASISANHTHGATRLLRQWSL